MRVRVSGYIDETIPVQKLDNEERRHLAHADRHEVQVVPGYTGRQKFEHVFAKDLVNKVDRPFIFISKLTGAKYLALGPYLTHLTLKGRGGIMPPPPAFF